MKFRNEVFNGGINIIFFVVTNLDTFNTAPGELDGISCYAPVLHNLKPCVVSISVKGSSIF